jgi:hypothetical protein
MGTNESKSAWKGFLLEVAMDFKAHKVCAAEAVTYPSKKLMGCIYYRHAGKCLALNTPYIPAEEATSYNPLKLNDPFVEILNPKVTTEAKASNEIALNVKLSPLL